MSNMYKILKVFILVAILFSYMFFGVCIPVRAMEVCEEKEQQMSFEERYL